MSLILQCADSTIDIGAYVQLVVLENKEKDSVVSEKTYKECSNRLEGLNHTIKVY